MDQQLARAAQARSEAGGGVSAGWRFFDAEGL